jgi:alanine-glyoxylate transaminase/serine-glyoxylate transaminase/serine-pyruvate transaminase
MDAWGVDLAVAGSQKGLMCPAGLGILAASEKAMAAARTATMRRAYFDFADMARMNADGYFPYTPPTQLLHGLKASLARIEAEGLDAVIARHRRLADGVRRAVAAWGLDLVAEHPSLFSDTVSAIRLPETVDGREVLRIAYEAFNTSFGAGLGPLAGKVFRIGHLGDLNEGMCIAALGVAEMALIRAGVPLQLGAGVGAAQAYWAVGEDIRPVLRFAAE